MRDLMMIRISVEESLAKLPSDLASAERIHTEGVAECARKLAETRNQDPELAWAAGMLHDMGRIQAGEHTKRHGKIGADLSKKLLSGIPDLTGRERKRIVTAIRLHVQKNRMDDPFSELLKDADAWQLAQQVGTFGRNPYRRARALLANAQLNVRTNAFGMEWPPSKPPEALAKAMEEECRELSLALAPFLDDEKKQACISPHVVHALRRQARKTASLLAYLSPLLPADPCRSMLAALRTVLSAVGPVRDADVLVAWLQKSIFPEDLANPPGTPDPKEAVLDMRTPLLRRLWRMREKRLVKAVSQVCPRRADLAAFSDAGAFSCLSLLSCKELEAFHMEQTAALRRSLSTASVSLIRKLERKERLDRSLHKFRLQAKSTHFVFLTTHAAAEGTDPCYPTIMDALEEIRILLGEWQDMVAGTALLQKVSNGLPKKKRPSAAHPSPILEKWRKHVTRLARRTERNAHSLLFILQKLL